MLTAAELARMRTVANESMLDTCTILTPSFSTDAIGGQIAEWQESAAQDCGVSFAANQERTTQAGVAVQVEVVVRLPVTTQLTSQQRIKLTHRYGTALLTPWLFEVLGQPETGPTALVVRCRRVLQ